jgi:hypothetical protein
MFNNLRSWLNLQVTIKPCTQRSATGSKVYGTAYTTVCYAAGKVQVVKNTVGKEVVSIKQLYFDGNVPVSAMDTVVFEGVESDIQAISYSYRDGKVDLKVVYL